MILKYNNSVRISFPGRTLHFESFMLWSQTVLCRTFETGRFHLCLG